MTKCVSSSTPFSICSPIGDFVELTMGLERLGRSAIKSALDGYLHRPFPAIFDAGTEVCISCRLDLAKAREQQPAMRQCSNTACEKRSIAEWLRPRIPCRQRERLRSKGKRMAPLLRALVVATAVVILLPLIPPAFAHHFMGGELPSTAWQGLLSGLAHPIIGIDHFAFTVGVGLMSQLAGRIVLLPLLFVTGSVLGCFIHIQGFNLPWTEAVIGLSVATAAAIVARRSRIPVVVLLLLFGIAGVFHGYAYGESIVGAETAPLSAYVIGFGVIQYSVAVASGILLRMIVVRDYVSETMLMRLVGGGMALVAVLTFVNSP